MTTEHYYDSRDPDKRYYSMRILAQDPSVLARDDNPLIADVDVPSDRIEAGPRGHRIRIIDYDSSKGVFTPPAPVDDDGASIPGWGYADPFADKMYTRGFLTSDAALARQFRCQNVYAIVSRTLARFEFALGRRIPWGFGTHELYVVPHAFADANAYYAREDHALYFGYIANPGAGKTFTSLSHDIIAHETSHALLDGLRPGFMHPGLPDQAAFHEGFADVVALLSILSLDEIVADLLGAPDDEGRISTEGLTREALQDNAVFKLAEELGEALMDTRGAGLRQSILIPQNEDWKTDVAYIHPHRRGEVLVAAVLQTLLDMWIERLEPLIAGRETVDRAYVAEEGAKAAAHLLNMSIRAIDYMPPTEFEFDDFVTAVMTSDKEAAPQDKHEYRRSLSEAFAGFGLSFKPHRMLDLADVESMPLYANLNFGELRTQPDEIYRFIWANAALLGVATEYYLKVGDVRPSVRVGPDGLIVNEIVATYTQQLAGPISELVRISRDDGGVARLRKPGSISSDTEVSLRGGGALIFDQFGKLKYHHAKPLLDWDRQNARLRHLVDNRIRNTSGGYGFSSGTARGQRFADLHVPASRTGEDW